MSAAAPAAAPRERPSHSALLIIDMIGTWDFVDADKLLPAATAIAPRIARLKARCRRAGWAIVYANDNRGRWRSNFHELVEQSEAPDSAGAAIAQALMPEPDDYFVLKPKHSAFFCTPLQLLLQQLQCKRLVLTGVASDQCIALTAADALMREFDTAVPQDCIATQTEARQRRAVLHLEEALRVATTPSPRLRLAKA